MGQGRRMGFRALGVSVPPGVALGVVQTWGYGLRRLRLGGLPSSGRWFPPGADLLVVQHLPSVRLRRVVLSLNPERLLVGVGCQPQYFTIQ